MDIVIGTIFGAIITTIAWYFVLRNNRSKINTWLQTPEDYFAELQNEVGVFSNDAKQKIEELIAEIKSKQK